MSSTNLFEKWDKQIDTAGLKNDIKDAQENKREYSEVPLGKYEVEITKMEIKSTQKTKMPMLSIWFKILAGEKKNSFIFYNQVISQGFQIHIANEFLRSLDTGIDVEFDNFTQYNNLVMDIAEKVEELGLEYALDYGENDKGYNTFEILEVFEG